MLIEISEKPGVEPDAASPLIQTTWDAIPEILTRQQVQSLLQVKSPKTFSRLVLFGQLPKPVISMGNIRRWRKEDIRRHLEKRYRMG